MSIYLPFTVTECCCVNKADVSLSFFFFCQKATVYVSPLFFLFYHNKDKYECMCLWWELQHTGSYWWAFPHSPGVPLTLGKRKESSHSPECSSKTLVMTQRWAPIYLAGSSLASSPSPHIPSSPKNTKSSWGPTTVHAMIYHWAQKAPNPDASTTFIWWNHWVVVQHHSPTLGAHRSGFLVKNTKAV